MSDRAKDLSRIYNGYSKGDTWSNIDKNFQDLSDTIYGAINSSGTITTDGVLQKLDIIANDIYGTNVSSVTASTYTNTNIISVVGTLSSDVTILKTNTVKKTNETSQNINGAIHIQTVASGTYAAAGTLTTDSTITSGGKLTVSSGGADITGNTAITGTLTVSSDTTINGNLTVSGTTTTVNSTTVEVEDNLIATNKSGNTLTSLSGLAIVTGTTEISSIKTAYGIVYDNTNDVVKLGSGTYSSGSFGFGSNQGQSIATRDDSITNNRLVKWDNTNHKLVDSGKTVSDLTYTAGTAISISNSNEISVKTGGSGDSTNKKYAVSTDSSGNLEVTVPWENTHYSSNLVVASSNTGTSQAASTDNSTTFLNLVENSAKRSSTQIVGAGGTTVTSSGGTITITSASTTNAFSTVAVKASADATATNIEADATTDTLTLVAGTNVTLTPDATNDKITISANDTTYSVFTSSSNGLAPSTASANQANAVSSNTATGGRYLGEDAKWHKLPATAFLNTISYVYYEIPASLTLSTGSTPTDGWYSSAQSYDNANYFTVGLRGNATRYYVNGTQLAADAAVALSADSPIVGVYLKKGTSGNYYYDEVNVQKVVELGTPNTLKLYCKPTAATVTNSDTLVLQVIKLS